MRDYFDFSGKTVLVTGSTKVIGKRIAHLFIQQGASVIINGRNLTTVEKTVDEIKAGEIDKLVYGIAANLRTRSLVLVAN